MQNTVANTVKDREKIMEALVEEWEGHLTRKRKSFGNSVRFEEIERICVRFVEKVREKGLPMTGPIIMTLAQKEASRLQADTEFRGSIGWLDKFKERHAITGAKICGEATSVNKSVVDDWKTQFPIVIGKQCWNCDETGLFYR